MIPAFTIKEHVPTQTTKPNQTLFKPSLFAQNAKPGQPVMFKLPGQKQQIKPEQIQSPPQLPQSKAIPEIPLSPIQEAEYILQATSAKSSSVRNNAFASLSTMLKHADLQLMRWFYHPETSPATSAITCIEKFPKDAFYPLQLLSDLLIGDENFINEICLPFVNQIPIFYARKPLGIFHNNLEFGLEAISSQLNYFDEQSRNLAFLLFERYYIKQPFITELFEGEAIIQLNSIVEKGTFLNMAGRISLRNLYRPGLDFSAIELLMANYEDSEQGKEILQILSIICANLVREERKDEINLYLKFLSKNQIYANTNPENSELLSRIAYTCGVQVVVDDDKLDKIQSNLKHYLMESPFLVKNCSEFLIKTSEKQFEYTISEVLNIYAGTQTNLIQSEISQFLEIQAPKIIITDEQINKIYFLYLFDQVLVDNSLPKGFQYLTRSYCSDIDYLSKQYNYEFSDDRVLDNSRISYIAVFMLENFKIENFTSILPKMQENAQDLSFIMNYVNELDILNINIDVKIFKVVKQCKLSHFKNEEVFTKNKIFKRFYSVYFEFMLSLVQKQVFIDTSIVEILINFADYREIELDRLISNCKQFYNIE